MGHLPHEDEISLEVFRRISEGWGFASPVFAEAFREVQLTTEEKESVIVTVREMVAQYRRLEFALTTAGGKKFGGNKRHLALMLAARLLNKSIDVEEADHYLSGPDWDSVALVDERIKKVEDPELRFALKHSLPDSLAQRLLKEFGSEAPDLADAFNKLPPTTLRVNSLKGTRADVKAALLAENIRAQETELAKNGLIVENPGLIFSSNAFQSGRFEIQDEGSQIIAELVEPARGSRVLDVCAGAGGKTLALSALMGSTGTIFALDTSEHKLDELRKRARRADAYNIRALYTPHESFPPEVDALKGKFNRVLVDAPCGGSGALRRNPEARWREDKELLNGLPVIQEKLLRRALNICAPGGRVIYSTCSLLNSENEAVAEKILAAGGCEIVPIKLILGKEKAARIATPCGRFVKLLPHKHGTDGFFAAVFKKPNA